MKTKAGKKALSVILAITLMLTTFVFFDIGSMFGSAVDTSDAITVTDNEASDVYFFVPEQVYLKPAITAGVTQAKHNYQWFVDSTVDESTMTQTLRTGENTEGNFYFYYENASQVTISYKYLNPDFSEMTAYMNTASSTTESDYANANCTIKLAAYSTPLRASNTSATGSYIYYTVASNKISTTITQESVSPVLLNASTGYYIEWTAKYVDKNDGQTKCATAYTYVYKPYLQPVGVGLRTRNGTGSSHKASNLSWVSGIHSLVTTGNRYPNSNSGGNGLLTFSSTNAEGVSLGVVGPQRYAQFAASTEANGYFKYSANNNSAQNWLSSDGASSPYTNEASFNFYEQDQGKATYTSDHSLGNFGTSPTAGLTVDVSRYSSFAQIPNLTVGMMVTSDEDSDSNKGAWYIGDCSDRVEDMSYNCYEKKSTTQTTNMYNNYSTLIASQGSFTSLGAYESEGVKYNGPITINFSDSSSCVRTYKIRTGYVNYQSGDHAANVSAIPIQVTQTNKEALRAAVNRATAVTAKFGLKPDGTSAFYNSENENWTKLVSAYKVAAKMLAKLDLASTTEISGYTMDSAVAAIDSAVTAIESDAKLGSTATARFLALTKTESGYTLSSINLIESRTLACDVEKDFEYGQNVSFKALTFGGYDYVGACAGLKEVDSTVGEDYSSIISTTDTQIDVNYATADSNVEYTFIYAQQAYSTIVDTRGGDYNLLQVINSNYPSIGGMSFPTYAADLSVETDLNYNVSGNDVTAWTTEATTLAKHQFLPYVAELEVGTEYVLSYKVTGTDAANVSFSLYSSSFTGGNGATTSYYVFDGSESTIKTSAVDTGKAYLQIELLGDARNGKKVLVSDLCLKKADKNEVYLQTSTDYPANYVASATDKMGMSYTVASNTSFTATSQYNSNTYEQRQLLPLYVTFKPNCTYVISYDVSGLEDSQISLDFVNDSFTGGNGSSSTTYSFAENGSQITVGTADDGVAQLKITYAAGLAAGTKVTISNLTITNLDSRTTITGMFSDLRTLGIPVKEGYKFTGWTVKSNDTSSTAYGTMNEVVAGSIYQYQFGAGMDVLEAQWSTDVHTVIFRNTDGSVIDEQSVAHNSAAKAPSSVPTQFGYKFKEWDTDFSSVTRDLIVEPIYEEITINVSLDKTTASVYQENDVEIQATFDPNEPEITDITWKSSNPSIATVTGKAGNIGVVHGVAAGSADITVSVSYNGKTYTSNICTVTVQAKKPTAVAFVEDSFKTSYYVGDTFDKSGMQIEVSYNNGSTEIYNIDNVPEGATATLSNPSTSTTGSKTLRLTYKEAGATVSTTTKIQVSALEITGISFSGTLTKKFYVGDTSFDDAGLKATLTYNSGKSETVDAADLDIDYSGFVTSTAGTITMTGEYQSVSGTFDVEINAVELESIAVNTMPNKVNYFVGDEFAQDGLTLTATYNNGKTETISSGISCTGFSSNTAGVKTITASYGGKTTTFTVSIEAVKLSSISVKTMPNKTTYYVGDSLDSTGLVLSGHYNNGSDADITEGFVCSLLDSSSAGTKTITVVYQGFSTSFDVTVEEEPVVVTGIAIKKNPTKVSYFVGDSLDTTGLTVTVSYSNSTSADITTGFSCSAFDSSSTGTKTITVTYEGFTATFDVTVNAVELVGIEIKTEPTKVVYNTGDSLDTTGLVLTLKYNNGSTTDVTEGFTTEGFDTTSARVQTITVKYADFSDTFTVTVNQSYANYDKVDEAIAAANAKLAEGIYTDETVKALEDAINAVVRNLKADEQATVDGYEADIIAKMNALDEKDADYSAVIAAKEAAQAEIDKGIYTEETVKALKDAMNAVVEGKKISEQETVTGYANEILAKMNALNEKPSDFSKIDELYTEISLYDSSLYENYDEIFYGYIFGFYAGEVQAAKTTYTKISDQPEVDKLYTKLVEYKDMLILAGGEPQQASYELINGASLLDSKYIIGLNTGLTTTAFVSGYIKTENATVTVKNIGRYVGTGSVVTITNSLNGDKMAEFTVLIYGDVSGDGQINANDLTYLSSYINSSMTFDTVQTLAANVNGDRYINALDYVHLNEVVQNQATLNQTTGKVN